MSDDDFVQPDALDYVIEKLKEAGIPNPRLTDTVDAMGRDKVTNALKAIDLDYEDFNEAPGSAMKTCKTVKEMAQSYYRQLESMG